MSFKATSCPACQRHIQIPEDLPAPACPYCGHFIQQEGAAPAATITTLLGMARTALAAGNNPEAVNYFNRALEADPRNSEAWMGKGIAAAWQSSIANMRISEMLIAFGHGIANAPEAKKDETIATARDEANKLIVTLYGMSRQHLMEFVSLQDIWTDYLLQISQLIAGLEQINAWSSDDKVTLENIVHLCKDNIEGVSYRDQFNNNSPRLWSLSKEYEDMLTTKYHQAAIKLKALDPNYLPPPIEKKKADACFVVTATMGDHNHPNVVFMRRFRDEWLSDRRWGASFINWYYRNGPHVATYISGSTIRMKISFHLIVRPVVFLAKRIMQ